MRKILERFFNYLHNSLTRRNNNSYRTKTEKKVSLHHPIKHSKQSQLFFLSLKPKHCL